MHGASPKNSWLIVLFRVAPFCALMVLACCADDANGAVSSIGSSVSTPAPEAPSPETSAEDRAPEEGAVDEGAVDEGAVDEGASAGADEASMEDETASADAPNFLTTYQCLRPEGECEFRFEKLDGVQRIDLGSGHASPPTLEIDLEIQVGHAHVGDAAARAERSARGTLVAGEPRRSLLGGAYYLALRGEGENALLRVRYESPVQPSIEPAASE